MSLNREEDLMSQRVAAFVFGELTGVDAIAFEKELNASPELQAMVQSTREAISALEVEFEAETSAMSDGDRAQVQNALASPGATLSVDATTESTRGMHWWGKMAVAAAILVMVGYFWLPSRQAARLAMQDTEDQSGDVAEAEYEEAAYEEDRADYGMEGSAEGGGGGGGASSRRRFTKQPRSVEKTVKPERAQPEPTQSEPTQSLATRSKASGARGANTKEPTRAASSLHRGSGASQSSSSAAPAPTATPVARQSPSNELSERVKRDQSAMGGYGPGVDAYGAVESYEMEMEMGMGMGGGGRDSGLADGLGTPPAFDLSVAPNSLQNRAKTIQELNKNLSEEGRTVRAASGREQAARATVVLSQAGDPVMDEFGISHALAGDADRQLGLSPKGWPIENPASGDRFQAINDNPFRAVTTAPLSTFSIDVDTAAYSKLRMYLMQHGRLPRPDAVRIEELVNYFDYDYQSPTDERPFSAAMEVATCPWNPKHRLARIGIKGKEFKDDRPSSNLVFLLDVSGSMSRPNKLPLVIDGMKRLVENLTENDSVAIVVYAGAAGLVLDSTTGDQKKTIVDSLERLKAGGSTAGAQGIQLAYDVARDHFIPGGTNRVILCSDGDFNVGVSSTDALVKLAEENAKSNIFLSVLGYGIGNHNDAMMEQVSNKANGNYAFIDTAAESEKVFVEQMQGTLVTIAKDVKIQIEFNPAAVQSYRLIGYENRILAAKDFDDDTKDAGEIGAGHTVTALYEIVPVGAEELSDVAQLRYQKKVKLSDKADSGELLTLKLRYKPPAESVSKLLEFPIKDKGKSFSQVDQDFQFAASVAAFGMLLRDSPHKGDANFDSVEELATAGAQGDKSGYRSEFVEMIKRAREMK